MLTYSFDNIGTDSMYEYLYKCIKNDILNGSLPANSKLPSKRSFARNLGISTITVENAYAQLTAEGYIYSLPKKGYYVSDIKFSSFPKRALQPQSHPAVRLDNQTASHKIIADFTSNQTCSQYFPFSIWSKLIRDLLNDSRPHLMTNPPCGGIAELREAIAQHLKDFHGLIVSPEQIITGAGTEYLYGILIQLLGFDKRYAIEDPGYHKIAKIYNSFGVSCDYISMDEKGVKISELQSKDTDIIHISPSHQFPTGITMPVSRRYELLSWASEHEGRYIIEDDYDSEFRLTGQPIPTLQSIDVLDRVIYMNTFTKTLASTVRISYMVLPQHLADIYYEKLHFYSCTVSNFEQYTLAAFINDGYFEKHINRMRNHYHDKRDLLLTAIRQSSFAHKVTISGENAGLHFLMKTNTTLSDDEFCRRALSYGIRISALSHYYAHKPSDICHEFIINYSSLEDDQIKDAVAGLELLLSNP